MSLQRKGIILLLIQVGLVLSIAVNFAWERHTYPRVWTRVAPVPPEQRLRGHYLDVFLLVDACSLPADRRSASKMLWIDDKPTKTPLEWRWPAATKAINGRLTATTLSSSHPDDTQQSVLLHSGTPCNVGELEYPMPFFLLRAERPYLAKGEELWAEVTVPPSGPPRPIQLAVSNGKDFRVLNLH